MEAKLSDGRIDGPLGKRRSGLPISSHVRGLARRSLRRRSGLKLGKWKPKTTAHHRSHVERAFGERCRSIRRHDGCCIVASVPHPSWYCLWSRTPKWSLGPVFLTTI